MDPLLGLEEFGAKEFRTNTWQTRRLRCGVPAVMELRTFETFPGDPAVCHAVREWVHAPATPGLVAYGKAGGGKTSLLISACHTAADLGVGELKLWNFMTLRTVGPPLARPRPAPVWFESWAALRARLQRTWRQRPRRDDDDPADEEDMILELETRVALLALDDIDIDALSDWKEMLLLRMVRCIEERGQRVIWSTNVTPDQFLARFGERMADRLMSRRLFTLVPVEGATLR